MKQVLQAFTLSVLLLLSLNSSARCPSGVYVTASDFMNKKLSYEKAKIHLNNSLAELSYLTVIDHGKKVKLNKRDVYGFVDCNNKCYRFNNNSEYQITEAGNITIYLQKEKVAQSKGYKIRNNYYFSTSAGGEMIPLNLGNLKNAYRTNDKFIDLLDQYFGNGDATVFDNTHNTYKVNYVYAKALR